ncbi:hypothetical protein HDV63DRAFT_368817 [Trichoderma sp. SZMC 28014]
MVAFKHILLLAASVSAASILRRDATQLVNAINNQLAPQISLLESQVNKFPASGLNGTIQLDQNEDHMNTILDTATTLGQEAGSLSLIEVLDVVTAMGPVTTGITNFLYALDAKANDFDAIGRASFVLANLQIENIRWTAFTNELVANAPLGFSAALIAVQATILESYAYSIKVFSDIH